MITEIEIFAYLMYRRIEANSHKDGFNLKVRGMRGWKDCGIGYLMAKLMEEVGEVGREINRPNRNRKKLSKECADVANILMMISDNFGDVKNILSDNKQRRKHGKV